MNEQVRQALQRDRTIDITTIGRKTGLPRRIEIWFHNSDDHLYLTGLPGPRSWYANLLANPNFIFHLKENIQADLPARATPVVDKNQRRNVLSRVIGAGRDIEAWVQGSPLVEVELEIE